MAQLEMNRDTMEAAYTLLSKYNGNYNLMDKEHQDNFIENISALAKENGHKVVIQSPSQKGAITQCTTMDDMLLYKQLDCVVMAAKSRKTENTPFVSYLDTMMGNIANHFLDTMDTKKRNQIIMNAKKEYGERYAPNSMDIYHAVMREHPQYKNAPMGLSKDAIQEYCQTTSRPHITWSKKFFENDAKRTFLVIQHEKDNTTSIQNSANMIYKSLGRFVDLKDQRIVFKDSDDRWYAWAVQNTSEKSISHHLVPLQSARSMEQAMSLHDKTLETYRNNLCKTKNAGVER